MKTWIALFFLSTFPLLAVEDSPKPYADFGKRGAGFQGPGREDAAPIPSCGIRIGFACPEKTWEGREFRTATQLALDEKNRAGGFRGKPFVPVYRFDDGPWGMVSKQIVALAYEDEVWAIVGGLDGGRAHVAELIAAKAWIPVVNTAASDATIDYANVPWVFRLMPSDSAQARALLSHAQKRSLTRIVLCIEDARDARSARRRIEEAMRRERLTFELVVEYSATDPGSAVERLREGPWTAILLWGRHDSALGLLKLLRAQGVRTPVLAPADLATPEVAEHGETLGDLTVAAPYDPSAPDPPRLDFEKRFEAASGKKPSPVAAAAYDATRMTLEAVDKADLSRPRIRDALSAAQFDGLCGRVRFQELGGNPADPVLLRIEGRKWIMVTASGKE